MAKFKQKSGANKNIKNDIKKFFPVFILPTLVAFIIGFVWPFIYGLFLSFFKFKTLKFMEFVGLNNYYIALTDKSFLHAFWFTCLFTIVSVILINVCAFALAYALTTKIKGSTVFRTIFFMPNLIGGIVLAYVWKQILESFAVIVFSSSIQLNSALGFWSLIILVCWQQIGYMMIIYIAGLQNVPVDYVEAAQVDGASGWQILRKIILPTVMPSITICTFLSLTNGFKLFDQNLALTGGNPISVQDGVKGTEMLALNIYNAFYQNSKNAGIGQAKAVIFFLIVVVISLTQLWITKKKEVQA